MSKLILALVLTCGACAALGLSPKDATTIVDCQQVGRDCKADGGTECYAKYDACMVDGGMR